MHKRVTAVDQKPGGRPAGGPGLAGRPFGVKPAGARAGSAGRRAEPGVPQPGRGPGCPTGRWWSCWGSGGRTFRRETAPPILR